MKSVKTSVVVIFLVGGAVGFASVSYLKNRPVEEVTELKLTGEIKAALPASAPADSGEVFRIADRNPEPYNGGIVESFHDRVAAARAFESTRRKKWELERLFEDMTAENAPEILALIQSNREYGGLSGAFFEKWGEVDGLAAMEAAKTLEDREQRKAIKSIFNRWAQVDLNGAWSVAQTYLDDENGAIANLARGVLKEVAHQDPDLLVDMLNDESKQHLRLKIADKLIEAAMESGDPEGLIVRIGQIESLENRSRMVKSLFGKWGESNPDLALESFSRLNDPTQLEPAMEGFLNGWSRTDPKGAFEYAWANQDDPSVEATYRTLLRNAIRDGSLEENEILVERILEAGLLDKTGRELTSAVADKSPELAMRLAEQLSDPERRMGSMGSVLWRWARTDFDAAREYYSSIESVELKERALGSMAFSTMNSGKGAAVLSSILDSVPHSPERSKTIQSLMSYLDSPALAFRNVGDDYIEVIKEAALSDTHLSPEGQTLRDRIFPKSE